MTDKAQKPAIRPNEKLWGAAAIAKVLGVTERAVSSLATEGDAPIYRPPGANRYFAYRSELIAWMASRDAEERGNET